MPHMNSMQSTMSPQALVYIHFTLLTYAPEQICLLHCIYMSHYPTTLVYIQTPHYCIYICKTSNPAGFEFSSNIHKYYIIWQPYLFFIINDHLSISCLVDIYLFSVFIQKPVQPVYTCVFCFLYLYQNLCNLYTHVYNTNEVLGWQPQRFNICKWYLFFHSHDPFSIPFSEVICPVRFLLQFINISYLIAIVVLSRLLPLMDSLFGIYFSFSLLWQYLWKLNTTCIYTKY